MMRTDDGGLYGIRPATIASPRISPHGFEAAVAGDDDRAAFAAARDQREEQVRGLAFRRQV